jgi:hypothetical protein
MADRCLSGVTHNRVRPCHLPLLLRQQDMSKLSFRRKPGSRINLTGCRIRSGMTFYLFGYRCNKGLPDADVDNSREDLNLRLDDIIMPQVNLPNLLNDSFIESHLHVEPSCANKGPHYEKLSLPGQSLASFSGLSAGQAMVGEGNPQAFLRNFRDDLRYDQGH